MARYCSATSLVALALLGCLYLTGIGAQQWPQGPYLPPQTPPVAPPPQWPGKPPQTPPVAPPPQWPGKPPQTPPVAPPPQWPGKPPQAPPVLPPPQRPGNPPQPPVLPPPQRPGYPPQPPVLPPPQRPGNPPQPPVLPPPQRPGNPPQPPVLPPPQRPKNPPQPPVLPPPQRPKNPPQPPPVFPPPRPKNPPQPPPVLPPPRPKNPPQPPPVLPPPRPKNPPQPRPQVPNNPPFPQRPGYDPSQWNPQVLPLLPPRPPQTPPARPGQAWSGHAQLTPPGPKNPPVMPPVFPPSQDPRYPGPWQPGPSVWPGYNPSNPSPPYTPGKKIQPRAYPESQSLQEPQVSPPQRPYDPPQSVSPPVLPPKNPSFQTCDVEDSQRVPCGGSGISAAACEAISCCYDGRQCYFGKAVTVQCTKDAHFIVVVARDATLPNIDLETISLLGQGQGCAHVDSNSAFAIYHFPVTACGSVVSEEPGVIVYENRMSSAYEVAMGPYGAITRDSSFELLFQCRYTGISVEAVTVEVLPLDNPPLPVAAMGPLNVYLRLANGQCAVKGCDEEEAAYLSYYTDADYPVTKVLRDPVYVEVLLLGKTDPSLYLTLGRCWTTTSSNPHSLPQWDILLDGCPNTGDRYTSSLIPVSYSSGLEFPSHYRRFSFKMFTFVDPQGLEPLNERVYLHCSTAVCNLIPGGTCEPSCHRKSKRDVKTVAQKTEDRKIVVSSGPVIMTRE